MKESHFATTASAAETEAGQCVRRKITGFPLTGKVTGTTCGN